MKNEMDEMDTVDNLNDEIISGGLEENHETVSFECAICHEVENGVDDTLFDFDMYKCKKCGKIFHVDCLGLEPDSELDTQFIDWFNEEDGTDIEFDREEMPEKFCPLCRIKT